MNQIITARPENMSFDKYKKLRREQTIRERRRRKHGILAYVSSEIYDDPITGLKMKRTSLPAIRTEDKYGNVKYVPMRKKELR